MADKQNVRVDMIIKGESATGKAWFIQVNGGPTLPAGKQWEALWIPKRSVVETDCLAEGDEGYMVLEHWVAKENGLLDDEVEVDHDVSGWQEEAIIQWRRRWVAELEGQQEGRMSVSIDLDISALPRPATNNPDGSKNAREKIERAAFNSMHISAYLTDEGLVVDVFYGEGTDTLVTGYELFSNAGLYAPQSIGAGAFPTEAEK